MPGTVEKKLADLGIKLPSPAAPVANYVPFVRTGKLLVISGQLCLDGEGKLVAKGQLGGGVSIEDGQKAARACAINVLAQLKAAISTRWHAWCDSAASSIRRRALRTGRK